MGFSGVVVALTGKTAEGFGALDRLNLRILLQVSALTVIFSIVPLILHRALDASEAWRLSLLLYGFAHLADAGYFVYRTLRIGSYSCIQIVMPVAGATIAIAQVIVALIAAISYVEVLYLLVLVWHLAIAGMGFVFLILASRRF